MSIYDAGASVLWQEYDIRHRDVGQLDEGSRILANRHMQQRKLFCFVFECLATVLPSTASAAALVNWTWVNFAHVGR
jgi:hypothetical protein